MRGSMQRLPLVLAEGAILPTYGSDGAAAMDLYAPQNFPRAVVPPKKRTFVDTGVAMAIPQGYWGHVLCRSGLARNRGMITLGGVIDSDYRGTIGVTMYNSGDDELIIEPGMRIAQMVVMPCLRMVLEQADSLDETVRGTAGFGSTGS